uniref:Uncharacterized protein n=1 Tax=Ralstonia solanacearum TaxID=305 RepID=A0A0S4VA59_RALSL|nr:protein of unknown function [Ralstonia solanacearum]
MVIHGVPWLTMVVRGNGGSGKKIPESFYRLDTLGTRMVA